MQTISEATINKFHTWAEQFSNTPDGAFLQDFDWRYIPVQYSSRCNSTTGIMGMYSAGKIYIMPCLLVPLLLFPTYIHLLYHRWQWITHPLFYILGKLIRPLILNPADELTLKVEKWVQENIK